MKPRLWIACGALLAGLSVAAGAFGAHGLKNKLTHDAGLSNGDAARRLEIFDTAARYHMYHALAIIATGMVAMRRSSPCSTLAGVMFVLGIVIFSGCLYAMALGGPRTLGRIVPIGGVAFVVGWLLLALAAFRASGDGQP